MAHAITDTDLSGQETTVYLHHMQLFDRDDLHNIATMNAFVRDPDVKDNLKAMVASCRAEKPSCHMTLRDLVALHRHVGWIKEHVPEDQVDLKAQFTTNLMERLANNIWND